MVGTDAPAECMKQNFGRITVNPKVMTGRPCIRGMRITVTNILDLLATGHSRKRILAEYPDLEPADIDACLQYAAWLARFEQSDLQPA
jgi:uncharacterized protein (DUF433 family)